MDHREPRAHQRLSAWQRKVAQALVVLLVGSTWVAASNLSTAIRGSGTLELVLQDVTTGKPAGGRIVILDERERPKRLPLCVMEGESAFVFHELILKLPEGAYRFEIDAGLEYRPVSGTFEIKSNEISKQIVGLERAVDLEAENWASLEQGLHAPQEETAVIATALGLDVAGFRIQPIEKRRGRRDFPAPAEMSTALFGWYPLELGGARLALWDPSYRPFSAESEGASDESETEVSWVPPQSVAELLAWKEADPRRCIVIDSALAQSLPFWVGLGLIDGVALLSPYDGLNAEAMPRRGYDLPAMERSDPARGLELAMERYRELLDAGVVLSPLGLSRWEGERPFGEHRSYTTTQIEGSPAAPWDAVKSGLSWATNGPLPRFDSSGSPTGSRFLPSEGEAFELDIAFQLSSRYKVDRIEMYREGGVVQSVTLDQLRERQGRLAERFTRSGWLMMVVRAQDPRAPRLAVAAPFRVDYEGSPFVDPRVRSLWLERLDSLESSWQGADSIGADAAAFEEARTFWRSMLE